ncbi:His-Xaa-Ser repeat protein HxsA3 [Eubacterium sp.]|uniref:His-Xaa-Ser repeat protein HxsA3 n=1 Tax=Eubacterium sp. TaxID=142586 RepID=UPI00399F6AA2
MDKKLFPTIKKSIDDLINDEEGNIPRGKLVMLGSTIMLMGMIMGIDVFAAHSSHRSHSSHSSHSSTSYHRSHVSHTSHSSGYDHSSHGSHSSHSNTHSSHGSHSSAPAHVNSNTGVSHISNAGGSIPGTSEIPVPQKPLVNDFVTKLPDISAVVGVEINSGITNKPEIKKEAE